VVHQSKIHDTLINYTCVKLSKLSFSFWRSLVKEVCSNCSSFQFEPQLSFSARLVFTLYVLGGTVIGLATRDLSFSCNEHDMELFHIDIAHPLYACWQPTAICIQVLQPMRWCRYGVSVKGPTYLLSIHTVDPLVVAHHSIIIAFSDCLVLCSNRHHPLMQFCGFLCYMIIKISWFSNKHACREIFALPFYNLFNSPLRSFKSFFKSLTLSLRLLKSAFLRLLKSFSYVVFKAYH